MVSAAGDRSFFAADLKPRIQGAAQAAYDAGRRVTAVSSIWYLFFAPIFSFIGIFILQARFFSGYAGFRHAVHESVFLFVVNARLYEMTHADTGELDRIKKEFD